MASIKQQSRPEPQLINNSKHILPLKHSPIPHSHVLKRTQCPQSQPLPSVSYFRSSMTQAASLMLLYLNIKASTITTAPLRLLLWEQHDSGSTSCAPMYQSLLIFLADTISPSFLISTPTALIQVYKALHKRHHRQHTPLQLTKPCSSQFLVSTCIQHNTHNAPTTYALDINSGRPGREMQKL